MMQAIKGSPGYSLVEFLVAMLILALVSLSWLTIAQVQSANRESYRREAVERLAGMMDVISQQGWDYEKYTIGSAWCFKGGLPEKSSDARTVNPVFSQTESMIGYRLTVRGVKDVGDLISRSVEDSQKERNVLSRGNPPVLIGELFDQFGTLDREEYGANETTNLGERFWRVAVVLRM